MRKTIIYEIDIPLQSPWSLRPICSPFSFASLALSLSLPQNEYHNSIMVRIDSPVDCLHQRCRSKIRSVHTYEIGIGASWRRRWVGHLSTASVRWWNWLSIEIWASRWVNTRAPASATCAISEWTHWINMSVSLMEIARHCSSAQSSRQQSIFAAHFIDSRFRWFGRVDRSYRVTAMYEI